MHTNRSNKTGFDAAALRSALAEVPDTAVLAGEPPAPYTSYKIGGPTAVWAAPQSAQAVGRVLEIVHRAGVPLFVLSRDGTSGRHSRRPGRRAAYECRRLRPGNRGGYLIGPRIPS